MAKKILMARRSDRALAWGTGTAGMSRGRASGLAGMAGAALHLEKLGNSHQVPKKDPLFVYFCRFWTFLSPFHAGFVSRFCVLQKCHILGC